tara:strand:+ start:93 stop:941 length:849 start_codon:yes stop_codon:yes gene_type:complete
MILLTGATGYIGRQFVKELDKRDLKFIIAAKKDCTWDKLADLIDGNNIDFVINAAGYTGKPNVDACESNKDDTVNGNIILPLQVSIACTLTGTHWGHVSSGCIYSGDNDGKGFTEKDEPNFSFNNPPCSFYSGTKALSEDLLKDSEVYIWRLRIPFDEYDGPKNYISKMLNYDKLLNIKNSMSHRADFVSTCLDIYQRKCPHGIYNITNPGSVNAEEVVKYIKKYLRIDKEFKYFKNEEEFNNICVAPRSNCILNTDKLAANGIIIRTVHEAIIDSLIHWRA